MFSFHKPKVYRSTQGCCICKAKSSSSRFTDSKKYENDFIECFQLVNPRKGEICNACVLLVKRFKRLPPGSNRHWGHVVDARVGPGLKSMIKFKKRKEEQQQQLQLTLQDEANGIQTPVVPLAIIPTRSISSVPERFCKIFKKTKKKKIQEKQEKVKREGSPGFSDEISTPTSPLSNHSDDHTIEDTQKNTVAVTIFTPNLIKTEISRNFIETLLNAHAYEGRIQKKYKRKSKRPLKNIGKLNEAIFIDNKLWRKINTCCGYVFENKIIDAVILDVETYKLCDKHNQLNIKIDSTKTDIDSAIKDIALIRRINNATNAILNQQTGLIIKENNINCGGIINGSSNKINLTPASTLSTVITSNNNNVIGKVSDNVNVPTTAVKKHHLYSKRQNIIDHINRHEILNNNKEKMTDNSIIKDVFNIPIVYTINSCGAQTQLIKSDFTTSNNINNTDKKYQYINNKCNNEQIVPKCTTTTSSSGLNYLHKIKADSSKIIKNSLDKITPAKIKDSTLVKNFVKICTDKSTKAKIGGVEINQQNGIEVLTDAVGNKFSDNSSDSGYEEAPLEQVNMLPKLKGIGARSVVLANGIKVHVQPQNLVRAANWAGVPQTTMVTLHQQTDNNHYSTAGTSSVQHQSHNKLNQTTSNKNIHLLAGPEPLQQKPISSTSSILQQSAITTSTASAGNNNINNSSNNIVLLKQKFIPQTAN